MTSTFLFINSELLFTEEVGNKLKEIPEIVDIYNLNRRLHFEYLSKELS